MSIAITGSSPSLDTRNGSESYLMLYGSGYAKGQSVSATWTNPSTGNHVSWSGSIVYASPQAYHGVAYLTAQNPGESDDGDVTGDISITVSDPTSSATATIQVKIYSYAEAQA